LIVSPLIRSLVMAVSPSNVRGDNRRGTDGSANL
jgi:hypothetical protein